MNYCVFVLVFEAWSHVSRSAGRSLANRNKSACQSSKLWIWQGNLFGFLRTPVNAVLSQRNRFLLFRRPPATWAWATAPKRWCQLRHEPTAQSIHSSQIHKHLAGRVCKTAPQSFPATTYIRHAVLVKLSRSSSTPVKYEPGRWRAGHRRLWNSCFGRHFDFRRSFGVLKGIVRNWTEILYKREWKVSQMTLSESKCFPNDP